MIRRGEPVTRTTTRYDQYEYFVPTLDVRSIGSGGGSIVAFDEDTRSLRVGPRSAGAVPGPAAYGRGGDKATVTDAALVLGYLNPKHFLGGALSLDADAAAAALERAGVGGRVTVPRTNVTPNKDESRDYRSYYSPGTRARVAEWYQPEIKLVGYGY